MQNLRPYYSFISLKQNVLRIAPHGCILFYYRISVMLYSTDSAVKKTMSLEYLQTEI